MLFKNTFFHCQKNGLIFSVSVPTDIARNPKPIARAPKPIARNPKPAAIDPELKVKKNTALFNQLKIN
jgi:hypothetical protein